MTQILTHLILYGSVFLIGYQLCRLLGINRVWERWGLSWLLGMGVFTYAWFIIYFLFHFPFDARSLELTLETLNGGLFILNLFVKAPQFSLFPLRKQEWRKWQQLPSVEKVIIFSLFVMTFFIFFQDFFWPVTDWDALALYDFRAKVIVATGTLASGKDLGYFFQYPLFTSLLHAASYLWGLQEAKIWYAFIYQSFLSVFYSLLRRRMSRKVSLLGTILLAVSPFIFFQALMAYTNLAYTALEALGFMYLWQWLETRKNTDVLVGGILVGLGTWVRMAEPFYLVGVLVIAYGCITQRRVTPASILAAFLCYFTRYPWDRLIFLTYNDQVQTPVSSLKVLLQFSPLSLLERIGAVVIYVNTYVSPVLFWYSVLMVLVIIYELRNRSYRLLAPFFTIGFFISMIFGGTLILSFTLESWNRIGDSLARMSIFVLPLCLYLIFMGDVWQLHQIKKRNK